MSTPADRVEILEVDLAEARETWRPRQALIQAATRRLKRARVALKKTNGPLPRARVSFHEAELQFLYSVSCLMNAHVERIEAELATLVTHV